MAIRTAIVRTSQNGGSGLNPALNVWRVSNDDLSAEQVTAALVGFTYKAMGYASGLFTLDGISIGPDGGPQWDMDFPTAAIEQWNTDVGGLYEITEASAWGQTGGNAQEYCPPGSSITVIEQTGFGGRKNGRKYLPWLSIIGTNAAGVLTSDARDGIAAMYSVFVLGLLPGGLGPVPGTWGPLDPVVGASDHLVQSAYVSLTPSRLRSRIR